jgi:dTDP-4-dehydrorhamnose 3,5-epimerase
MNADVTALPLSGAFLLSGLRHRDARGDFRRVLDLDLLRTVAGDEDASYFATAHNLRRGTIRGLHYQAAPYEEAKTVWCTTGSIFDVLVDLRADEPTFGQWISVGLSADEVKAVHVPRGVAHGYQTTEDDALVSYLISGPYRPDSTRTIKWDDPTLKVEWPLPVSEVSAQDAAAELWRGA